MVDFNAIVQGVFAKLALDAAGHSARYLNTNLPTLFEKLRINFAQHLKESFESYSKVRTLLNRDEAINISSIYTETRFTSSGKNIKDVELIKMILEGHRVCVTGTGGCGKSMFMKHLLLNLVENGKGKIPIFIEMRHINSLDKKDIIAFLHYNINKDDSQVSLDNFINVLKEGSFIIILDGFDEIDFDHRVVIERQIIELTNRFPKNGFVISSRPDQRFSSWNEYRTWHVQPMELNQVVSLISKLNYDKSVKSKFISTIKASLYKQHKSFLSNPLLATMMLLTYDQFAHIPDKIHLFYEQAFETLFFKHDSSKQAGYQRRLYSGLAINEFKNCFSCMCIITYTKEKFVLNESDALENFESALKIEKKSVPAVSMLKDSIESICIMQREGLYISFTHRSFQEYFSAHFVSRGMSSNTPKLLDRLIKRTEDNVVPMAFDMNSALIERQWLMPKLIELVECISKIDVENDIGAYIRLMYTGIDIRFDRVEKRFHFVVREKNEWTNFVFLLYKIYKPHFEHLTNSLGGDPKLSASIIEEMRRKKIFPAKGFPRKPTRHSDQTGMHFTKDLVVESGDLSYLHSSEFGVFVRLQIASIVDLKNTISKNLKDKEDLIESII